MRALPLVVLVGAACSSPTRPARPAPAPTADGVAAFATVRAVLQHPRCQNCHADGDTPLQGDEGRVHLQNVLRGPVGLGAIGAECGTCHGPANPPDSYGDHIPPGTIEPWRMPPPARPVAFVGRTPRALCEELKDPAGHGGKDLDGLRARLDTPLMTWGWAPGFGRAPIATPRDEFLAAWDAWAAAGAPCPE